MARLRKPPWVVLLFLVFAGAMTYGGFSTYADQHSGTPGTAEVTGCTGGSGKYDSATHCRGIWTVGGDPIFGSGSFSTGPVEGAGRRDIGKTIDVRIHGTDHATVPSLGTSIMLWALGGPLTLLCLYGLWSWWRDDGGAASAARESGRSPA